MSVSDELIGANVVRARGDMSQKDVAGLMRKRGWKWSQATVWSVEKGERPLRLAESADLAAVLDVHVSWFMLGEPVVQVELANRRMSEAHTELEATLREWLVAKFNLALVADDAADELAAGRAEAVRDWLNADVAETERHIQLRMKLQDQMEDRYEQELSSEPGRIADLQEEAMRTVDVRQGPFMRLLTSKWDPYDRSVPGDTDG